MASCLLYSNLQSLYKHWPFKMADHTWSIQNSCTRYNNWPLKSKHKLAQNHHHRLTRLINKLGYTTPSITLDKSKQPFYLSQNINYILLFTNFLWRQIISWISDWSWSTQFYVLKQTWSTFENPNWLKPFIDYMLFLSKQFFQPIVSKEISILDN